jgi:hypothetical protein
MQIKIIERKDRRMEQVRACCAVIGSPSFCGFVIGRTKSCDEGEISAISLKGEEFFSGEDRGTLLIPN